MWRQALATENEVARFGDTNPVAMEGVHDAPETRSDRALRPGCSPRCQDEAAWWTR